MNTKQKKRLDMMVKTFIKHKKVEIPYAKKGRAFNQESINILNFCAYPRTREEICSRFNYDGEKISRILYHSTRLGHLVKLPGGKYVKRGD